MVTCPPEERRADPTGVGDAFRAGFLAGLSWGVSHERCAQIGSLLATYVIETVGTQEYELARRHFLDRIAATYGDARLPPTSTPTCAAPRPDQMPPVEPPASGWRLPHPGRVAAGQDLVALGGDLEPGTLLAAYRCGLFPMPASPDWPMGWWSPDPRGILPCGAARDPVAAATVHRHPRHGIRRRGRELRPPRPPRRLDHGGNKGLLPAAAPPRLAHSIEAWDAEGRLAGGLYGLEIGGLFAGGVDVPPAARCLKVALVELVARLRGDGGEGRGRRRAVANRPPGSPRGRRGA